MPDSRQVDDINVKRRKRRCKSCGHIEFTTEAYDREYIINARVRDDRACGQIDKDMGF